MLINKGLFRVILVVCMVCLICSVSLPSSASGYDLLGKNRALATPADTSHETVAAMACAKAPDHLFPFVYEGSNPAPYLTINTANCVVGKLYVFDKNTNAVLPIADTGAGCIAATLEHLYFVDTNNNVVQTDYTGSFFTTVFEVGENEITYLHTYGQYVCVVENREIVTVINVPQQSAQTVMIGSDVYVMFLFDTDKLIWRNGAGDPFYYNITTGINTALEDEQQLSALLNPYLSTSTYADQRTYSVNSRSSGITAAEYNDVNFPLDEYPAILQYGFAELAGVQSFFNDYYAGSHECDGFAKMAHDRFWHLYQTRTMPSWQFADGSTTLDYHGATPAETGNSAYDPFADSDTVDISTYTKLLAFFQSIDRGTFIRYISVYDDDPQNGNHSIVFDGLTEDGTGFYAYECNQKEELGRPNAVGYQIYNFYTILGHYIRILYYVEHVPTEAPVYYNSERHTVGCVNCDGYLRQTHTGTIEFTPYNSTKHFVSYSCCDGYEIQDHLIVGSKCKQCKTNPDLWLNSLRILLTE